MSRRAVDLVHYLAATLLMVVAVESVDRWHWTVAVIVTYLTVCVCEGWIYGDLAARTAGES